MCTGSWMVFELSWTRYTKSWFLLVHRLIKIWFHTDFLLGHLILLGSALTQFLVGYLYGQKHVISCIITFNLINFVQFLNIVEKIHYFFGVVIHGSWATRRSIFGFSPWQEICGKVVICLLSRGFLLELYLHSLGPVLFKHTFIPWEARLLHQWLVARILKLIIAFGALRR